VNCHCISYSTVLDFGYGAALVVTFLLLIAAVAIASFLLNLSCKTGDPLNHDCYFQKLQPQQGKLKLSLKKDPAAASNCISSDFHHDTSEVLTSFKINQEILLRSTKYFPHPMHAEPLHWVIHPIVRFGATS